MFHSKIILGQLVNYTWFISTIIIKLYFKYRSRVKFYFKAPFQQYGHKTFLDYLFSYYGKDLRLLATKFTIRSKVQINDGTFVFWRYDLFVTEVHLGTVELDVVNPHRVNLRLAQIVCHPAYDSETFNNDICLLRLSKPVKFNKYIQPICLPSETSNFHDGNKAWVTGFGVTGKIRGAGKI